jgi:aldose 1-epimerase
VAAGLAQVSAQLDPERFRGQIQGRAVRLLTLRSDHLQASICTHGARLLQLWVPDVSGQRRDVVLGHDSLPQLLSGMSSMGAFVGRFANRIAGARYRHAGAWVQLPANDGPHILHGGPGGSRHRVFDVLQHTPDQLSLGLTFTEADDGFPGEVDLQVHFRLNGATLEVSHEARVRETDSPLNFTFHPFFNLQGEGSVMGHQLQIEADRFLPVDAQRIPLGHLAPVQGTAFDFRQAVSLDRAHAHNDPQVRLGVAPGFDHAWVTGLQSGVWHRQARLFAPASGIGMEVWSDAPGVQFYSGLAMDGTLPRHAGKGGQTYSRYAGLCLEPQHLPDAPNQPLLGTCIHRAGSVVKGRMAFSFRAG